MGYHWGEKYITRLKNPVVFVLPGSFVAGFLIYSILSFLYTPIGISIPLSILISTLVFGLSSYYFLPRSITTKEKGRIRQHNINASSYIYRSLDFFAIWVYGILFSILVLASVSEQDELGSYIPWEQITSFDSINLANAIAFSFFLPGYGLVVLLDKNCKFSLPIKFLLAYLISILFVALPSYAGASFGYTMANIELFIIALYGVIFVLFLLRQLKIMRADFCYLQSSLNRGSLPRVYRVLKRRIPEFAVFASLFALVVFYTYYLNDNQIVVDQWFHHGRALLIGSGNYEDIAPAESYKDPYTDTGSDITQIYPPIFSSLLAGFFELSNSASINAYVSIGFLNVMPVFAFHYFFTRWVPDNMKRASLLAATLFVLSSGFGWLYAVDLAMVSPPDNEMSSINILAHVSDTAYDIGLPTTFINVGHPDITTPLIIIALPAGFISLGMIKEFVIRKGKEEGPSIINTDSNKNRTFETAVSGQRHFTFTLKRATGSTMRRSIPITLACFLGILSHDEFYLFIIIACTAIVALLGPYNLSFRGLTDKLSGKTLVYGYSIFFSSFLIAMFMVALVDTFISPTKYYVTREIAGIPLICLCFIYASSAWVAYVTIYAASRRRKISLFHAGNSDASSNNDKLKREITGASTKRPDYAISKTKEISGSSKIKKLLSIRNSSSPSSGVSRDGSIVSLRVGQAIRLSFPISMVSVVAFLYLFTFLVWSQLSVEDINSQIDTDNEWNVPWYLYPMKFGLTGLLGLAFLLSYLFKRFDKELFVFAIVAFIALLSGPYYDEHRFGKYIMVGMASLAALLIYKIISRSSHLSFKPLGFSWLRSFTHFGSKFNVVVGGILLGLAISFSGLSIFMFAGFVEQTTGVADFNEGTRRDFPTNSEIQLLDFLHMRIEQSPEPNIALPYKEVDNNRGFLTKIYGFTPIPRTMLLQTPLVLNASTIETFINLLDYSAIKFIVLPKEDLSGTISAISNIYPMHNVINFALENFRKVFENDNFLVLEVPTLSPPSQEGDVALIYPKNESRKKEETYYQHYYPLSMLALSRMEYSTYMEGDLSAFSKKYVIVPYDPFYNDSSLSLPMQTDYTGDNSIYLDYVRSGGNLIVIDSADYGKEKSLGVFGRLLSINLTGNYAKFDSLLDAASLQSTINVASKESTTYQDDQGHEVQEKKRNHIIMTNISGMVERTLYNSNNTKDNNISITSYYILANNNINKKNENATVAPFTIEKKYGNGKITYINAHGYFHALFSHLSSNNGSNNDTYQGNNNGQHFLSLANITNLIDPNIPKHRQFSNGVFLNSAASPAESSGAPKIRQIIDNIRISPGYQTRINSSSLLLPVTNNSNGDLAAQELTFTSHSRIAPFSATNPSNENDIAHDLSYTETADEGDQNSNYKYSFKNAIIRNLKMYGSYEVIVQSNNSGKLLLPVFPSFSDYVGVNLPEGFDMTIKLSDSKSSYAEFEIIEENDDGALVVNGTHQRLRIYGDNATAGGLGIANVKSNEIHFFDMRSDPSSSGHTSLLMKIPQIQVKEEGAATASIERDDAGDGLLENVNTFLTFNKDLSETDPIEIKNEAANKEMVIFRIDYIDSYNAPHPEGTKNHSLTYIEEDIKVVEDNVDNDASEKYRIHMPDIKLPGDISDRAKKLGVDVHWQETMTSGNGLLLAILVTATSIIATIIGTKKSST